MHGSGRRQLLLPALVVGALLLELVAPLGAVGAEPRRAPKPKPRPPAELRPGAVPAPDSIIVRYRGSASASARAAVRAGERLSLVRQLKLVKAEVVRPKGRSIEDAIAALKARGDVLSAEPNFHRALAIDPSREPLYEEQWALNNTGQVVGGFPGVANVDIDAPEALAITGGSPSIVIAVIDDGVDFSHPDLDGSAWVNAAEASGLPAIDDDGNGYVDDVNGYDFCHGDGTVHDLALDFHGTAVASVIAGEVDSQGISGVAPGVKIMALKILEENDVLCGTVDQEIAAIAYAKANGAHIVNASFGAEGYSDAEKAAIEASGLLFSIAAGNGGSNGVGDNMDALPLDARTYPAAYDSSNIISVAAIHNQGGLSNFSNYGPISVDVSAPGEDIKVAVPGIPAGTWALWDGTSFAAPHVTGVAALAATVMPGLLSEPVALRQRVLDSAWGLSTTLGATATGGVVDARFAIDATPPTATAPSPSIVSPATLGSSNATVRIAWPAATDDATGVASYDLQQSTNGGTWTTIASGTTSRAMNRSLAIGGTFRFRVIARDGVGNPSSPAESSTFAVLRYQESSAAVRYRGTWLRFSSSSASGGRTRYTSGRGNWARLTFTGTGVAFVAPKSRSRGSARIYVDGVLVKTVSLYSSVSRSRQVIYQKSGLAYGTHTMRVLVLGTRGHPRVDLDAFVILR